MDAGSPGSGHEALVAALRAAGETTRLRILSLLRDSDLTVKDLTLILGQSQPRISRHLKLLADAGLIARSAEGAFAFYRLADTGGGSRLAEALLAQLDPNDPIHVRDRERRDATHAAKAAAAADFFAANADVWDRIRSLHVPEAEVEAAIRSILGDRPIRNLLDVGTGTGRMLELMADRAQRLLGVDASAAMLSVARANLAKAGVSNARLAQDDIYALSVGEDRFDVVIIHQVLHFLDNPGRALAEAARTLRPGGRLLVVDFAPHHLEELRTNAQHRRLGIADSEMADWLRDAHLDSIATERLSGAGTGDTLTVSLWLAKDPRIISDDIRQEEGAYA
ncbi:ArsR family transcriptional regulator [Acuticoccus sediminis]|uniref:ArsR family transcriptional regulator n=1 Tax=Acuticoccus sediminis TaxID=2184697 RepID=A0A8B2NZH7_9HYPH|nr:metalloregulator ArsR/SmtB family transcription factor [Acuticoccus sediminis]RAI03585.1 ArsR family transcriptional regulator [Acuticoccus sediminis]